MKRNFTPQGVCSKKIYFEVEEGVLRRLRFQGGCPGNLRGLALLAEGRPVEELARLLAGIKCGDKGTSCPDQLARALAKKARRRRPEPRS